ncbi:MAG: hypothetical protein ABSF46_25685 [Terriglobia bacterium]
MPTFSGKVQYLNSDGSALQAGPCRVSFEAETLTLTPASGAPLALDFGDIDIFLPGEYELTLTLYTGNKILLHQFGKTFQDLCHDLLEAYRKRLLQCLLLEDMEEITRFEGTVRFESPARTFSSPAELRLFKSNLAVLPTQATGLQWRFADIDAVSFDERAWTVTAVSGDQRLTISRLAKRTEEFRERLTTALGELAQQSAEAVHGIFPFLSPDQFQQAALLMKEGRAASLAQLRAIDPRTEQALNINVVDAKLKPYFDALRAHVPAENYYASFKLLRETDDHPGREQEAQTGEAERVDFATLGADAGAQVVAETAPEPAAEAGDQEAAQPILHWFFLPLAAESGAKFPNNLVAWEATSRSGRATYFLRLVPPEQAAQLQDGSKSAALIETAIRQLNRAIVLLNFRREPIYLPDDSLLLQPRFRRYAIACRKLPELVRLRSSFLGRAIHTTPAEWQKQFKAYLAKA